MKENDYFIHVSVQAKAKIRPDGGGHVLPTQRCAFAILVMASMILSGCFAGEEEFNEEIIPDWDSGFDYIAVPNGYDDPRIYNVTSPWAGNGDWNVTTELWENRSLWGDVEWAVFGNEEGGNCCEHYLAATKEGWIMNFGGEYPTWSEDRGHTWKEYRPSVLSQFGCREPKPTVPGQEGLGEGSIVQATNGDIIAMGWFPYPSTSGVDQFYAFFYDADDQEWSWCFNRTPEPFYDRSWQVEVVGPISGGIYGNGDWASIVISNFWHQVQNIGGQISTDGLNYDYFGFPDRDSNLDVMAVDLNMSELGPEWDFTKPHKEMRSFPVPTGGLYFPNYFVNGDDAYLDTNLDWWKATTVGGNSLPSEYCSYDSSAGLHCVVKDNTTHLTHLLSWDGGETWLNQTYDLSVDASEIEEWEFHANGEHDLFVLNVRYQSSIGPDLDIAWHVRDYSLDLHPDSKTFIGLGNLDSTSGAGQDIRFDFASMGILPDGGSFIAYHDGSDDDPLFGVELYLPEQY
jgi:hypothetical protein